MGCYDFFAGTCPHCKHSICETAPYVGKDVCFDCRKQAGECKGGHHAGVIQTKTFWCEFREIKPGDIVPIVVDSGCIGTCGYCKHMLIAVFKQVFASAEIGNGRIQKFPVCLFVRYD